MSRRKVESYFASPRVSKAPQSLRGTAKFGVVSCMQQDKGTTAPPASFLPSLSLDATDSRQLGRNHHQPNFSTELLHPGKDFQCTTQQQTRLEHIYRRQSLIRIAVKSSKLLHYSCYEVVFLCTNCKPNDSWIPDEVMIQPLFQNNRPTFLRNNSFCVIL